ncbi:hypothetical protein ACI2JA_03575 [Alkalihalobacillus sp. NPDC078783]
MDVFKCYLEDDKVNIGFSTNHPKNVEECVQLINEECEDLSIGDYYEI